MLSVAATAATRAGAARLLQRGGAGGRSALLRRHAAGFSVGRRGLASSSSSSSSKLLDSFATVDPETLSGAQPYQVYNLVQGAWTLPQASTDMPDPLNGEPFLKIPDTQEAELQLYVESLKQVPKSGLHNPFKNPSRYVLYGDVSACAAQMLRDPDVEHFFTRLIQRVAPKSYTQAKAEVTICRVFFENFSGDQVRFLARSFGVPGDHTGQVSNGYRFPYGPVAIIAPFNFPLEIPVLQIMGALYMGNKVVFKGDPKVSVVMEQAIRMLHACGLPKEDLDFINGGGPVMQELLVQAQPRMTQFTGSSRVAEALATLLRGKIKIEDAGFDWKILGPDVQEFEHVAWTADQDAYAYSGQKCSAQSIVFAHENWVAAGIEPRLKELAARRKLSELTIGPVLTVTSQRFLDHRDALLKIPGARVMWGGELLKDHRIPECYGAWEPTAIYVPLEEMLKPEHFGLVTTEIFGPFYVYTTYRDQDLPLVLQALEKMENHLTAAVVSNDVLFQQQILASTVNGTTYCGIRARTTGAPQNHWFGPCGDPRGAGIGTPEAIRLVWSGHREVIYDEGPIPQNWKTPAAT